MGTITFLLEHDEVEVPDVPKKEILEMMERSVRFNLPLLCEGSKVVFTCVALLEEYTIDE